MNALAVWWEGRMVGRLLAGASGLQGFVYDHAWLQDGRPLSCSLPLHERDDYLLPDVRGVHYFANLLPEGNARDRLVRRLGIADDDFLLLTRLGGDCAGALSLWPAAEGPPSRVSTTRRLDAAMWQQVLRLGTGMLVSDEAADAPRLSLAGAQDKVPVCLAPSADEAQPVLELPMGGKASTHILKLPVNDLRHVPLYECYTSFMAERLGLPVAAIRPVRIAGALCSLSARYDRHFEDGQVTRLHQEDMCQALGRSRTAKYADSDAHLGLVADLLREHSNAPAQDLQALIRWQIVNALCGNADGHLKNLALLAQAGGGWRLAPFYDLVCVLAIDRVSHRLALPVGAASDMGSLMRRHWEDFAAQLGVHPRIVLRHIAELSERLNEQLAAWHADFQALHGEHAVLQRPYQVMKRQAQKAWRDWR